MDDPASVADAPADVLANWYYDDDGDFDDDEKTVTATFTRILRAIARKAADLHIKKLPPGVRVQQVRTVASVITSISVFVIFFVAALEILGLLGLNLGPMLVTIEELLCSMSLVSLRTVIQRQNWFVLILLLILLLKLMTERTFLMLVVLVIKSSM